jgi:hypothetical protein
VLTHVLLLLRPLVIYSCSKICTQWTGLLRQRSVCLRLLETLLSKLGNEHSLCFLKPGVGGTACGDLARLPQRAMI